MGFVTRVRNLERRERIDAEIAEELRAHVEMATEEMVRRGASENDARRAARLRFGNPVIVREKTMEADTALGMEGLLGDLRFALRQLRRSPGFAATVIVTLALGIGANTTVFSIVDAVLLRPLPYHQPQRLVEVQSSERSAGYEGSDVSYPDFFDWRAQNRSFEHLVSYHDTSLTLTGVERAMHLDGEVVSADLLPLLGVQPQIGRGFSLADEKEGARVALISHTLWVSQFASDPSIVGKTLHLSGDAFTVIGVMPASFRFPVTAPKNSFWTTLAVDDDPHSSKPAVTNRGMHFINVMGRLRPGVTVAQADSEMKAIAARLEKQFPTTNTQHNSAQVQEELTVLLGDTRTLLLVVLGAVGLVLLVACGNIANLLLARVREREREIAVRAALGAARARIVRQLLAESMVLGLAGGLAGSLLALAATPLVLRVLPSGVPRAQDAGVNLAVLGFAIGISLLCGVFFGTIPALMASRTNLSATLQSAGRAQIAGHDWLRSAVIVGQVALGIVLTASAGLLLTSFLKLTHNNEGFNPDHLLTYRFETPDSRYEHTRPEFYRAYFEKLRALPGVEAASGSMLLPMGGDEAVLSFENPEHPVSEGQQPSADVDIIAPEFFRTMEIPLIAGRDFSDPDTEQSPQVMIVSEAFAKKYFPGENPLGKKLKPGAGTNSSGPAWRTIVGVVGDVRRFATDRDVTPVQYLPASQLSQWCCLITVARTAVEPASLESDARNLVASMDRDIPVTDMRTMRELIGLQLAQPRFAMVLLAAFAGLALVLTLVGLYGVMMYSVARRTREIGVRLALGASRGRVMQMMLREAAVLVGLGVAIGIAVTLTSASVLRSMLYGTGARNPAVLALVCLLVALTGLLAAYLPALRASGIEPMQALRSE